MRNDHMILITYVKTSRFFKCDVSENMNPQQLHCEKLKPHTYIALQGLRFSQWYN